MGMPLAFILVLVIFVDYGTASLNITTVEEGDCKSPIRLWPDISLLKLAAAAPLDGWHILLSSKHLAFQMGEIFHVQPVKSEEELKTICLRLSCKDSSLTLTGFGNSLKYHCESNSFSKPVVSCVAANKAKNIQNGNGKLYVNWTDNKKYILLVRCLYNHQRDWALLSTEKTIVPKIKKFVFKLIERLGFDSQKSITFDYNSC